MRGLARREGAEAQRTRTRRSWRRQLKLALLVVAGLGMARTAVAEPAANPLPEALAVALGCAQEPMRCFGADEVLSGWRLIDGAPENGSFVLVFEPDKGGGSARLRLSRPVAGDALPAPRPTVGDGGMPKGALAGRDVVVTLMHPDPTAGQARRHAEVLQLAIFALLDGATATYGSLADKGNGLSELWQTKATASPASGDGSAGRSPGPRGDIRQQARRWDPVLERLSGWLAWPALAAMVLALLFGLRALVDAAATWRERLGLVLLVAAGAAARALLPFQWVMAYMGYEQVQPDALALQGGKYGPAGLLFQRALLDFGGEAALQAGQRGLGALSLLFAVGLLARLGAAGPALWLSALAAASMPALCADAGSESLLVLATALQLGGAGLTWVALGPSAGPGGRGPGRIRTAHRVWALAGAWPLWTLAAWTRPDALVLAPFAVSALALAAARARRAAADPGPPLPWASLGLAVGGLAMAWTLRTLALLDALDLEQALGNTPQVFGGPASLWRVVGDGLWRKNAWLFDELTPQLLTIAAVAGGAALAVDGLRRLRRGAALQAPGPGRSELRLGGGLVAFGLLALLPAAADLPWLSLPRLHAPSLWLLALSFGPLCVGLTAQLAARLPRHLQGILVLALAVALLASEVQSAAFLYRSRHDRAEHEALQTALALLPKGTKRLGFRSHLDAPDERVHLGMPLHLLAAQDAKGVSLTAILDGVDARGRVVSAEAALPTYVWLGTRCAMRPCDAAAPHPACARARRELRLKPVWRGEVAMGDRAPPETFGRRSAPSPTWAPDSDFPWCVALPDVEVGLYEVLR